MGRREGEVEGKHLLFIYPILGTLIHESSRRRGEEEEFLVNESGNTNDVVYKKWGGLD